MKEILAAATVAALVGVAGTASAADMYAPGGLKDGPVVAPPPAWTGFYIGANIGAAWADIQTNRHDFETKLPADEIALINSLPGFSYTLGHSTFGGEKLQTVGAFGGAQFGYNWQYTNWVLGAEVDLGGMAANGERTFVTSTTATGSSSLDPTNSIYTLGQSSAAVTVKSEGGFYGDVTGRVGYTWGPALLYAKGGFAWLEEKISLTGSRTDVGLDPATLTLAPSTKQVAHSFNNTLTGWTVGGGVEYMLNPNWTVKAEYLHFDLGSVNNTWNDFQVTHGDLTIDTVKLGVNYIWNQGFTPLK